jgi:hypothetical protein
MAKLVKKLGQFSQWTGEKLGSSQKTGAMDDTIRLILPTFQTQAKNSKDFKAIPRQERNALI